MKPAGFSGRSVASVQLYFSAVFASQVSCKVSAKWFDLSKLMLDINVQLSLGQRPGFSERKGRST